MRRLSFSLLAALLGLLVGGRTATARIYGAPPAATCQTFTSSGTWYPLATSTVANFLLVGGGGGGGGGAW